MKPEELFERHLRGELNERETAHLKQLLAKDASAGKAFVDYVNETNLIIRVGSQIQSTAPAQNVVPLSPARDDAGKQRRRWWPAFAAAACVVGVAIIAAILSRPPARPSGAEGLVSGSGVQVMRAGIIMDGHVIHLAPGDVITTSSKEVGAIAYENESTRIEIFPGTVVRCGNAAAGKQFELRSGAIQARVAPQPAGKPMLITTPHAQATVVGTEFVVRADERTTKLDVFQGKVELAGRSVAKKIVVKGGYWASATSSGVADAKALCKCSKCRGTNEPSNCPNLKKKNEN